MLQPSSTYSYKKYPSVDDIISLPNNPEIIISGCFFKDKVTVNASLEQAKEDDKFNAIMIENACFSIRKNFHHTNYPSINQVDKANIIAIKYLPMLQNKLDEKYDLLRDCLNKQLIMAKESYHTKGKEIFNELIARNLAGVANSDINHRNWVNENPLAKAMLDCIQDSHDQTDINAVISDRVIQFFNYKLPDTMQEIASLDTFLMKGIDEIINHTFFAENVRVTYSDELAASIQDKIENPTNVAVIPSKSERQNLELLLHSFKL
ncbi:hypothetical protein [Yersinia hibernica]|uniref:Uncharacterized protein n=1 Tax=Yersinia enterocolitica LC20 TaxID=1443113 RepID=A0A7U4GGQ9_YEREN|nr:hypothetical protein [Yersinia hibernica]AHM74935.2 hypothetical protein LC20_03682 [Yersinia hibernica]OVZ90937.1 hypothetical protein CBW54_06810 [Yersinia kristensenii]